MTAPTPTADRPLRADATTFAVYAPFGTDAVLSTFPDGKSTALAEHPLVHNLAQVARSGIVVVAYIDRVEDATWRVTFDADGGLPVFDSLGKQDMQSPHALAHLLRDAHELAPGNDCVLALEGHGAGFLPDLDPQALALDNLTQQGAVEWRLGRLADTNDLSRPFDAHGKPVITSGAPVLPGGSPTSPTMRSAMSTAGLAEAFQLAEDAGLPRIRVIHFNNCFNMAVEVLHTVAPYADVATGYCNYNFFNAGQAYPSVFERLVGAGSASAEGVAKWFAAENHQVLKAAGHEPTVAGTVELARMHDIVEKVDDLADALLAALRSASAVERPRVVAKIRSAIVAAQQYDSRPDDILDSPDELTDLDSLAFELARLDFGPSKVRGAARALNDALSGIKQYGDVGVPWMAPGEIWDFSSKALAMSIFLPDPLLKGLWDWRSQYYLDVNPDPNKPRVQRRIIDFVKVTDWVDFLIEYHKDTQFVGLLPARLPDMPVLHSGFNARYPRRVPHPRRAPRAPKA